MLVVSLVQLYAAVCQQEHMSPSETKQQTRIKTLDRLVSPRRVRSVQQSTVPQVRIDAQVDGALAVCALSGGAKHTRPNGALLERYRMYKRFWPARIDRISISRAPVSAHLENKREVVSLFYGADAPLQRANNKQHAYFGMCHTSYFEVASHELLLY